MKYVIQSLIVVCLSINIIHADNICINDLKNNGKIELEEIIYLLKGLTGDYELPENKVYGQVVIPESVQIDNIEVSNFSSFQPVDTDGHFNVSRSNVLAAVNNANGNLVYLSSPTSSGNIALNAKETAISLMVQILPITFPYYDRNLDALKELIYEIPAVVQLKEKIEQVVADSGYLNVSEFSAHYATAARAVRDAFNIYSNDSTRSMKSFVGGMKVTPSTESYLGNGRYRVRLDVYSQLGWYMAATEGLKKTDGSVEIIDSNKGQLIAPMDSTQFLGTFTTPSGVKNYFSDLYKVLSGEISILDSTWDTKHTQITMDIQADHPIVFTHNSDKIVIANAIYLVTRGLKLDTQLILSDFLTDDQVYSNLINYIQSKDWDSLLAFTKDKVTSYIESTITDSLLKKISKGFISMPSRAAGVIDILSNQFSKLVNTQRNNMVYEPQIDPCTIEILSPNDSQSYQSGQEVTIRWSTSKTHPADKMILSMKRSSVSDTLTEPDNKNWYQFTEHGASAINDGTETITIPNNLVSGNDWHFYVRYDQSDIWDASDSRFTYEGHSGETFTNSLGMTFVYIEPGTFMMGSPSDEPGRYDNETQHQVTLTKGYYLQTTEVTQGQWKAVMGNNPSYFSNCGDDCPVENVSWDDAQDFIQKLNQNTSDTYRLPTEAEWEYAARAGSTTALYNGPIEILGYRNAPALDPIAWYGGNSCVSYSGSYDCSDWSQTQYNCSRCGTHPVAQKQANAWGLYDMSGNLWEWCNDWYGSYPTNSVTDPGGASSGSSRVLRGGSWDSYARGCRSAKRSYTSPGYRYSGIGLRLSRTP
jgi:formylglycine-generating enzyme required for sulfatase activity